MMRTSLKLRRGAAFAALLLAGTATGAQAQGLPVRGAPEMSASARKALREMRATLDGSANGSTSGAEGVYFDYVKQQSKGKATAQGEEGIAPVEYAFVQGVLELVLHPPASASGSGEGKPSKTVPYSAKIVEHLLENRMVSSSMVEGGLLPALAARNDWVSGAHGTRTFL